MNIVKYRISETTDIYQSFCTGGGDKGRKRRRKRRRGEGKEGKGGGEEEEKEAEERRGKGRKGRRVSLSCHLLFQSRL